MENTKVDLINSIVELSDALQILIVLAADNKDPDYLKYENKAADILKQQYGAFSLYFNEIKHTRDIEELYRIMCDYLSHLSSLDSIDSNMLLYCLPWINVYGHNGYITEKPPFVDEWETTEQIAEPEQHTEPQRSVPKELTTQEAKKVLRRAITAGLLNEDYQAEQGVTRAQQKEFADLASQVLKIKNKWVVFGTLWNVNNLGQVKTIDAKPEKLKAVRKLFPELGFDINGKPKNKKEKFT